MILPSWLVSRRSKAVRSSGKGSGRMSPRERGVGAGGMGVVRQKIGGVGYLCSEVLANKKK